MDTPTVTNPNIPALHGARTFIHANTGKHDQDSWHCGTTACFAGHAALLDGAKWTISPDTVALDIDNTIHVTGPHGRNVMVADYAAAVLGLNTHEAHLLFHMAEDVGEIDDCIRVLEVLAAYTTAGHPAPPLTTQQWNTEAGEYDAYIEWREAALAWWHTVELAGADEYVLNATIDIERDERDALHGTVS